ncbi:hypothetical protein FACS1894167_06890 [Synergistales bacterium]|nr:hypothetical protein FACS1894167_06890 [Synergistales bacterium]
MRPIEARLEDAAKKIRETSFRRNKGLGNEVGYYIFDYPAALELTVREWVRYLQGKISIAVDGFELIVFDLYDIMVSLLEKEDFMEQCFKFEQKHGMDHIIKSIGRMLRLSDDAGLIVEYIRERTPENSVVFLTGVGKCYPILRSHKVMNNLHQILDSVPVVMLYPGKYDGQELVLFGSVKDDNYYRAFRLVD